VACSLRLPPDATSYHTPGCSRPFSAGRNNRCLRSAGSAVTNATPGRLKSTIRTALATALALSADSASGGRVGSRLAQPLPPRVDPLDHNGSCNGTRTGDEICDPVGGATMLPPPAGRAL